MAEHRVQWSNAYRHVHDFTIEYAESVFDFKSGIALTAHDCSQWTLVGFDGWCEGKSSRMLLGSLEALQSCVVAFALGEKWS